MTIMHPYARLVAWIFVALFSSCALAANPAPAAGPDRYDSTFEAIHALGDYPVASRQLERLEDGVRISPLVADSDSMQSIDTLTARAAVYAVYRTFVHTDAKRVHVIAYPIQTDEARTFYERLDAPVYDINVSRQNAGRALNYYTIAPGFESLVAGDSPSPNAWSYYGRSLLYADDNAPGAKVILDELRNAAKEDGI